MILFLFNGKDFLNVIMLELLRKIVPNSLKLNN